VKLGVEFILETTAVAREGDTDTSFSSPIASCAAGVESSLRMERGNGDEERRMNSVSHQEQQWQGPPCW
jgi:hypothetical protein